MNKKIVILYSGGLDSFIMHQYAKVNNPDAEIISVYYKHGQPAMAKELRFLPDFVQQKNVDWLDENNGPIAMKSKPTEGAIFIPGRNMVFITLAACQFTPDEIWMGSVANEVTEASTDKNEEFVNRMTDTLNYVLKDFLDPNIKVRIPLVEAKMGKIEAIQWGLNNGLTPEDIVSTPSCYSPNDQPCGECIQCLRRWGIFGLLGLHEDYVVDPATTPMMRESFENMFEKRQADFYYQEILKYMKLYLKDNPNIFDEVFVQRILALEE